MLLCEGSTIRVHKPKVFALDKPTPDKAVALLREKAARQTAYRMRDIVLDETMAVTWAEKPMRFSERSINRLASTVGIPLNFIRSESMRGTRAARRMTEIVNERLSDLDEGFTAVVDDDTIEGVLSPKYKRLPNADAADFMMNRIDMGTHEIARLVLEETRMALDIVNIGTDILPAQKSLLKVGDPIRFGTQLFNSEDAEASVETLTFVERLRCLNGATMTEKGKGCGRIRHTGEQFFARFAGLLDAAQSDASRVFDHLLPMRTTAISAEESAAIFAAISDTFSEKTAERVFEDAAINVAETPGELVATTKTEPLRRGGDGDLISVFNLWNGMTFQGHDARNLNHRRALEAFGGAFLRDWNRFVAVN